MEPEKIESEFQKSRIEKLKSALYSRNEKLVPREKRTPVHGEEADVPTDWGQRPSFEFSFELAYIKFYTNGGFDPVFLASLYAFIFSS